MNDEDILDDDFYPLSKVELTAVAWWEKKRLIYNGIVFLSGLPGLISGMTAEDFIGRIIFTLIYAGFMNICYSLGLAVELIVAFYWKKEERLPSLAMFLFVLGTISSAIVTLFGGLALFGNQF